MDITIFGYELEDVVVNEYFKRKPKGTVRCKFLYGPEVNLYGTREQILAFGEKLVAIGKKKPEQTREDKGERINE